jgi:hypothetical protein
MFETKENQRIVVTWLDLPTRKQILQNFFALR